MTINYYGLASVLALLSNLALADDLQPTRHNLSHQVTLAQVLDELMQHTGIAIHYSALPQGLVTAACVGKTVQQVMAYLVDKKIDLIVRSNQTLPDQPEEIWLVGNTVTALPQHSEHCTEQAILPTQAVKAKPRDHISALVDRVKVGEASERADALAALALVEGHDDTSIHEVLNNALSDEDANVRAQAVFSVAKREGAAAITALHAALLDKEPSVRLMAVSSAGDNAALLQQALADDDETVRVFAEMKLTALNNKGQR